MGKEIKTNAVRKLDSMKLSYKEYFYDEKAALGGTEVAEALGEDPARVFKTLVTVGKSGSHYVFMVPVNRELDLKKAAAAVGEKSVSMIKEKELLPLTGYVHGGCSPVGMKKFFRTTIHSSASGFDTIFCSAGKRGQQIEISLDTLSRVISFGLCDIIKEE